MKHLPWIAAIVACILAGAALAVALTHSGPTGLAGPAGPAGPPGRAVSVQQARYGVCWSYTTFTRTYTDGSSDTWVSTISVDPPQVSNGVYQCPQGETFVTIQPLPAPS